MFALVRDRPESRKKNQSHINETLCSLIWNRLTAVSGALINSGFLESHGMPDAKQYTPLMYASNLGFHDTVKLLLERECGLLRRDQRGHSALAVAISGRRPNVVDILLEQYNTDERKASLLESDVKGWSILMMMCYIGMTQQARTLLSLVPPTDRPYVDYEDLLGQTALYYAASQGNMTLVQLLIEHGASLQANNRGRGPIDVAREKEHREVADFIEEHKSPPSAA